MNHAEDGHLVCGQQGHLGRNTARYGSGRLPLGT